MEKYPELSWWALNVICKCPYRREAEGNLIKRGVGNGTTETEAGTRRPRDEPRMAGSHQKWEEAKIRFSPRAFRHLDLGPVRLSSNFWHPEL